MNKHMKSDSGDNPEQRRETIPILHWPYKDQVALAALLILLVALLLVGLPTATLLIIENKTGSLDGTISFWGALFAGFISLAVLFIGAVFAFTALKVETGAMWEARKAAEKGVKNKIMEILENNAKEFINKNGGRITSEVSYDYIYVKDNGARVTRHVARDYVKREGDGITREVADDYICVKGNGVWITRDAADDYVCKKGNGAKITEEAAKKYIDDEGENITRGVVEQYAKETLEDEDITRFEEITREIIGKINAEDVDRMVDEKLSSYGLLERLRICFGLPRRHSGPELPGNGKR